MKKFLDNETALEDFKRALTEMKSKDDKKDLYIFIAILVGLLATATAAIVWIVNNKKENGYDEDWDCEWDEDYGDDDLDDCDCDECRCTDKDVDKSVKIEQL